MDMKQLRYFTTVAQLQNFSRAADLLHISQSSLSKQIARLEAELGVLLFDRNGKKIHLNPAGMRFYDYSNMVLREIKNTKDDIRYLVRSQDYRIRIGTASISDSFLQCMSEFSILHPETEFIINSRIEDEEHLNINDYDALICPDEYKFEKLNGYYLFDEHFHFAVSSYDPLSEKPAFSVSMLKNHPLVFLRGSMLTPEFPFRVCSAFAVDLGALSFADTREMHRRIISCGIAAGFVPESEAAAYRSDSNITLLPVMNDRFTRSMKICFLREKHLSELGTLFRKHVLNYFLLETGENDETKNGRS